jgi:hypothetical protein
MENVSKSEFERQLVINATRLIDSYRDLLSAAKALCFFLFLIAFLIFVFLCVLLGTDEGRRTEVELSGAKYNNCKHCMIIFLVFISHASC